MKRPAIFKTAAVVALTLALGTGCTKKEEDTSGIPLCIRQKIYQWERGIGKFPAIRLERYRYHDGYVYYARVSRDDFGNPLYDEDCNTICVPDGGWDGNGDGKRPTDFSMTDGEEIWRAR